MKPAKPRNAVFDRPRHMLETMTPMINSVLMGVSYIAGAAGVTSSIIDEDGLGLALSTMLLTAAVALYFSTWPRTE